MAEAKASKRYEACVGEDEDTCWADGDTPEEAIVDAAQEWIDLGYCPGTLPGDAVVYDRPVWEDRGSWSEIVSFARRGRADVWAPEVEPSTVGEPRPACGEIVWDAEGEASDKGEVADG